MDYHIKLQNFEMGMSLSIGANPAAMQSHKRCVFDANDKYILYAKTETLNKCDVSWLFA